MEIGVNADLAKKAIKGFLLLAAEHDGKRFTLTQPTNSRPLFVIPKEAEVYVSLNGLKQKMITCKFNEALLEMEVDNVVFDVIGLHRNFATQLQVYSDGYVIISPPRGKEDVMKLLQLLAEKAQR